MASTGNQQCNRCIHKDVCRYIDVIEEIKTKYSFVSGISCRFSVRKTAADRQPAPETPSEEEDTLPAQTSAPAPTRETKPEPAAEQADRGMPQDNPYDDVYYPEDNSDASDEPGTIMDILVDKIGIREQETVTALHALGIATVQDIYDYQKDRAWRGIKGMTRARLENLSQILQAFNLPALKSFDDR